MSILCDVIEKMVNSERTTISVIDDLKVLNFKPFLFNWQVANSLKIIYKFILELFCSFLDVDGGCDFKESKKYYVKENKKNAIQTIFLLPHAFCGSNQKIDK